MKKVVRIIGRMNGGGPARQVAFLHRCLQGPFDTILVVGTIDKGEEDMRYLLEDSSGVVEIPSMSRSVRAWSDLVSLYAIIRLLIREKPDIVHTHTAKAGLLGRIAALVTGVPIRVHTYHGNVFQGYFSERVSRLIITIERILNRITTRVIAISESQAEELVEKFRVARREQTIVIRNGFDLKARAHCAELRSETRRHLGLNEDDFLVVWAGRLVGIKNVPLLLEVVHQASSVPKLKFLVAGEGPLRSEIEKVSSSVQNLQFVGWRRDMKPLLAAADAVLLTSRNEGTPAFLIEAMAAAKPFISTAVGGVPDLARPPLKRVSDECTQAANGFLTAASPEVILYCIRELMDTPALAAEMGQQGRALSLGNFDQDRLAYELGDLYEDLLTAVEVPGRAGPTASAVEGKSGD